MLSSGSFSSRCADIYEKPILHPILISLAKELKHKMYANIYQFSIYQIGYCFHQIIHCYDAEKWRKK
jgi:hypothetical protein